MDAYRAWLIDRARRANAENSSRTEVESGAKKDARRDRAELRRALAPIRKEAKAAEHLLAQLSQERDSGGATGRSGVV